MSFKRKFLYFFSFCLTSVLIATSSVMAAPVRNKETTLIQPDETRVPVKVTGDEYYQHVESLDGYTLCRNDEGWICYAQLNDEGSDYIATDVIYTGDTFSNSETSDPNTTQIDENAIAILSLTEDETETLTSLEKHIELYDEYIEAQSEVVKSELNLNKAILHNAAAKTKPSNANLTIATAKKSEAETVQGLTLLIDFPDTSSRVTKSQINDFFNKTGYSEFNNNGSVKDFFYDISGGMLTYQNDVVGFYTAKHNKSYYDSASCTDYSTALELVQEALEWLKQQGYDFSKLSYDSTGIARGINILYAGTADAGWASGLWPHQGYIPRAVYVGNGHYIQSYELSDIGSYLQLDAICHENGHLICGYPDLYSYDGNSSGTGGYSLMSSTLDTANPFPPDPYCRNIISGWFNTYDLNNTYDRTTITANSSTNGSHDVFKWSSDTNANEYFLIENVNQTGRYAAMPAKGLLIWHVDERGNNSNNQMTSYSHYMVSVEQADGLYELENTFSYGDSNDLFSASTQSSFNAFTTPNSNWWNGSDSGLSIGDISQTGTTMTFVKSPDGTNIAPDNSQTTIIENLVTPEITNNIASLANTSTSYCSPWETITALNNGNTPSSSEDKINGAYGNWPETDTQWIQYTWEKPYTITSSSIYWFSDGAGIEIPSSYEIQYLDSNNNWVTIPNASNLKASKDNFNKTNFNAISTTALRVLMTSTGSYSTGVLEWQVEGSEALTSPLTTIID